MSHQYPTREERTKLREADEHEARRQREAKAKNDLAIGFTNSIQISTFNAEIMRVVCKELKIDYQKLCVSYTKHLMIEKGFDVKISKASEKGEVKLIATNRVKTKASMIKKYALKNGIPVVDLKLEQGTGDLYGNELPTRCK